MWALALVFEEDCWRLLEGEQVLLSLLLHDIAAGWLLAAGLDCLRESGWLRLMRLLRGTAAVAVVKGGTVVRWWRCFLSLVGVGW